MIRGYEGKKDLLHDKKENGTGKKGYGQIGKQRQSPFFGDEKRIVQMYGGNKKGSGRDEKGKAEAERDTDSQFL